MGIFKGAILGGGIGAGIGYYKAPKGREWRGAAAGGMIGAAGGAAMQYGGGRILRNSRNKIGKWKEGSKLEANQAVNSFADSVTKEKRSPIHNMFRRKKPKLPTPDSSIKNINMNSILQDERNRGRSVEDMAQSIFKSKPSNPSWGQLGGSSGWKPASL